MYVCMFVDGGVNTRENERVRRKGKGIKWEEEGTDLLHAYQMLFLAP